MNWITRKMWRSSGWFYNTDVRSPPTNTKTNAKEKHRNINNIFLVCTVQLLLHNLSVLQATHFLVKCAQVCLITSRLCGPIQTSRPYYPDEYNGSVPQHHSLCSHDSFHQLQQLIFLTVFPCFLVLCPVLVESVLCLNFCLSSDRSDFSSANQFTELLLVNRVFVFLMTQSLCFSHQST